MPKSADDDLFELLYQDWRAFIISDDHPTLKTEAFKRFVAEKEKGWALSTYERHALTAGHKHLRARCPFEYLRKVTRK